MNNVDMKEMNTGMNTNETDKEMNPNSMKIKGSKHNNVKVRNTFIHVEEESIEL